MSPVADSEGRPAGRGRGRPNRRRTTRAIARGPAASPESFGYDFYERSPFLGEPVEAFRFVQGANTWRFTSADSDLTLSTGTYAREPIVHEALDYSQEDTAGNATVRVPKENVVASLFKFYIPPSPVFLTIFRKHRADPQTIVIFFGKVVSCSFEGPEAVMLAAPISQSLGKKVPAIVFGSQCNWNLYGPGCTVVRASFTDAGTVSAVSGLTVSAAIFATRPDGWYENGWVELATGERRFVVSHVGATVTLMNPFRTLAIGAAISGVAGCQRTEAVCTSKFNNLVHHLGFPRIPTRNPFEGSLV